MKKSTNKFGLSRYIPAGDKRKVRKRCGYGCVICGMGIYTYEHIDPPFSEAKEHNPKKITLLCGSCQLKVTKGIWSKDKVKGANSNPKCLQKGYTNDLFDIRKPFGVNLGRIYFYKNSSGDLLKIGDKELLSIRFSAKEPPMITGVFYDDKTKLSFEIKDNEWFGDIKFWDIETVGNKIIVRSSTRKIFVEVTAKPPHIISINRINMSIRGMGIRTNEDTGQIMLYSPKAKHIDVSSGVIATSGPVVIEDDRINFENGSFIALGDKGIKMNHLDFERLLKTGGMVGV